MKKILCVTTIVLLAVSLFAVDSGSAADCGCKKSSEPEEEETECPYARAERLKREAAARTLESADDADASSCPFASGEEDDECPYARAQRLRREAEAKGETFSDEPPSSCPFVAAEHDRDHEHECPHARAERLRREAAGGGASDNNEKINAQNYREWSGEYKNSQGQVVQVPLLFSLPGTQMNLLTPSSFLEFVSGQYLSANQLTVDHVTTPATGFSPTVFSKDDVGVLSVIFWYKENCGGLCEDAYAEFRAMETEWHRDRSATVPQSQLVNKSLLLEHNLVVQFAQYEVVEAEEEEGPGGDISHRFGPKGEKVFDFPTITLVLAIPEEQTDKSTGQVRKIKKVQVPFGFDGEVCAHGLISNPKNIEKAVSHWSQISHLAREEFKKNSVRESLKQQKASQGSSSTEASGQFPGLSSRVLQRAAAQLSDCLMNINEKEETATGGHDESKKKKEELPKRMVTRAKVKDGLDEKAVSSSEAKGDLEKEEGDYYEEVEIECAMFEEGLLAL